MHHCPAEAFGGFENDVARETIGDDDIHGIIKEIETFDISEKIQPELGTQSRRAARQIIAFGFFRTVAQNTHAWFGDAENFTGVNVAHHRELREVQGFADVVCAGIKQNEITGLGWHARGDRWTFNTFQTAQLH